MKKGKNSLYLHGKSSISSANPSKIVPITVTKTAIWLNRAYVVPQNLRNRVSTQLITEKAIAPANPTHYGIYFYPPLLPFLLISNPKILFFSINYDTLGMSISVIFQLPTPKRANPTAVCNWNWEIAMMDDNIAIKAVKL